MWEHNKNLNDMAHWRMGSKSHLFTVSDDRSCRVWDLEVRRVLVCGAVCCGVLRLLRLCRLSLTHTRHLSLRTHTHNITST